MEPHYFTRLDLRNMALIAYVNQWNRLKLSFLEDFVLVTGQDELAQILPFFIVIITGDVLSGPSYLSKAPRFKSLRDWQLSIFRGLCHKFVLQCNLKGAPCSWIEKHIDFSVDFPVKFYQISPLNPAFLVCGTEPQGDFEFDLLGPLGAFLVVGAHVIVARVSHQPSFVSLLLQQEVFENSIEIGAANAQQFASVVNRQA